jgi:hypothetical protein
MRATLTEELEVAREGASFRRSQPRGIATPQREIVVIKDRWRRAKQHHAVHFGSSAGATE